MPVVSPVGADRRRPRRRTTSAMRQFGVAGRRQRDIGIAVFRLGEAFGQRPVRRETRERAELLRVEQFQQGVVVGARSAWSVASVVPQCRASRLQAAGKTGRQAESPRRGLEASGANHVHDEIMRVEGRTCGRQSFGPLKTQWRAFHAHVSAAREDQTDPEHDRHVEAAASGYSRRRFVESAR